MPTENPEEKLFASDVQVIDPGPASVLAPGHTYDTVSDRIAGTVFLTWKNTPKKWIIGALISFAIVNMLFFAVAVLFHDFSDGINTVNIAIGHGIGRRAAFRWLLVDAAAPVVGAFSTLFFSMPKEDFGRVLALFCGFFLYIGASDLLPESQHAHPTKLTTLSTLLGVGLLYLVIRMVTD